MATPIILDRDSLISLYVITWLSDKLSVLPKRVNNEGHKKRASEQKDYHGSRRSARIVRHKNARYACHYGEDNGPKMVSTSVAGYITACRRRQDDKRIDKKYTDPPYREHDNNRYESREDVVIKLTVDALASGKTAVKVVRGQRIVRQHPENYDQHKAYRKRYDLSLRDA